ncbi:MAG: squalene synthase HpnC [gamma proteobacterium symbiont of Taylorina sp.]|nr:squalene synthase HpnC [gamma proteobacterium symbiont of Taylorina sp.]
MLANSQILSNAYEHCMHIAQNHYENFPIASRFLNKKLRYPVSAVYAFARTADDFADEGHLSKEQRLALLNDYMSELQSIENSHHASPFHQSNNPIFIALADVIVKFNIPIKLFNDLLEAFISDINTIRYHNFEQVIAYCQKSANPVGRILLYLNHSTTEKNLIYSDAICSGLQLINFYQDIAQDIDENNRLYIPLDEMDHFNVTIDDIKNKTNNLHTRALMEFQIQRSKQLFLSGKSLCTHLSGRFGFEIRLIYSAGQIILEKLENQVSSIYLRPRLQRRDKFKILWKSFFCR